MLLSSPDSILECDGRKIAKGFKLNLIHEKRQLRFKSIFYDRKETEIPIDLVIFKYSDVSIKLPSIIFTANGKEMNNDCTFNLKLTINLLKRNLSLTGVVGNTSLEINARPINMKAITSMIEEFISVIKK